MFNLVIGFVFLFILSFLLINSVKTKTPPTVEREGVYVIIMHWDEGVSVDLDLWVKAPNDERVGWRRRDTDTMSLLRDDLGTTNDNFTLPSGEVVANPLNREEVGIRVPQIGRYFVNVHHYFGSTSKPLTVKAELKEVGTGKVLATREMTLSGKRGEEQTLFTFSLDRKEKLTDYEYPSTPYLWVIKH